MMQLLPEHLRERTPIIPAVGQVQVPDLIDLDRGRARTGVHAQVRKAEVFLDRPLGKAKRPALLMGQTLLEGKVRLLRTNGDGEEGDTGARDDRRDRDSILDPGARDETRRRSVGFRVDDVDT